MIAVFDFEQEKLKCLIWERKWLAILFTLVNGCSGYAFGYVFIMLLLAHHLRHGVWSAFQSLGAVSPRLSPIMYTAGGLLGLLIAIGFLVLPLWIYFSGGAA